MTAPELKPCPFCGGEAEIWRAHEGRTAWIACMGKCVVLISKEYLSDDEAIAAWNRRADLAAVQPAQVQPDPRDEVIARLVEALEGSASVLSGAEMSKSALIRALEQSRAALAAAKAVQHG